MILIKLLAFFGAVTLGLFLVLSIICGIIGGPLIIPGKGETQETATRRYYEWDE